MRRLLLSLALLAILLAPLVAPYDPMTTSESAAQSPSTDHWLGTDALGRDVLSRVLHGGWRTVLSAASATVLTLIAGVSLGLLEAVSIRFLPFVARALSDALLALPSWLIALVVVAAIGQGWPAVIAAVALAQVAPTAKFTSTLVRQIQVEPYYEASIGIGAATQHLIRWTILPNAAFALASYAAVIFANSTLYGSGLTFLGLSGDLGTPEWGIILAEGRSIARQNIWAVIAPGLALMGLIWGVRRWSAPLSPR